MLPLATEISFIELLFIATLVAIAARRLRVPYTTALVSIGLLVGVFQVVEPIELTPQLIMAVFLPALLFEGAFHLDYENLRYNLRTIVTLAVPGVLISTFVVGVILHYGIGLSWGIALLFGALISPTDPISVLAIFKEMGAPLRLSGLIEGESLFNDGTAIVLFKILLGMALAGQFDLVSGVREFVQVAVGGVALGLLIGFVFSHLIRPLNDYLVEVALSLVLAYGTYLTAEALHLSSVIAVVVAGAVVGNYGTRIGMSATTKLHVVSFWEFGAFVANSLIFLLIGLQTNWSSLAQNIFPILAVIGAVLVARACVVYPLSGLTRWFARPLPLSWQHALVWGGLRGSLSLALALSLKPDIADREFLRVLAFGFVLFSLLFQGLTMRWFLNRLGIVVHKPEARVEYERLRGQLLSLRAAWKSLNDMHEDGVLSSLAWQGLNEEYRLTGHRLSARIEELYAGNAPLRQEEIVATRRELLRVSEGALQDALRQGVIGEDVYLDLMAGFDKQLDQLDAFPATGGSQQAPAPQPQ